MNLKFKTTLLFCAFFALGKVSSQNKYSMAFEGSLYDSYCPQNTTKEGRILISDSVDLGEKYSICFWAKNDPFSSKSISHCVCDINGKININFAAPGYRGRPRNIFIVSYGDTDRWSTGELVIEEQLKGYRDCDTSVFNWNYYSIIIDSAEIKIYVNGRTQIKEKIAQNYYHKGELIIGDRDKWCSSGNYSFDGNIDEFSIWKGALDSIKINNLIFKKPSLADSDLIHYWSFDKGSGNTVLDSKNSFNGSMNSGATWSNELPYLECLQCADSFAFNSDTLDFEGCSRDSLKIVASGNWAEYAWSNGSTDSFIYASESGEYRVNLKDSVGCEISDSFYFVNPGVVSVDVLSVDSVTCYGLGDGSVTTESSGGFQPYTYSWNDPLNQSASNAENLSDGTYQLIVSDKYGCSDSISVEVYEPDELVNFASTVRNIKCHNDSNGMISVEMRGGTKPYTFIWNNNRTTSTEIKNLAAGDYQLIVEDKNGCKDTSNFTLSNPDKLEVEIIEPIHTMKSMPVKLNVRVVPVGDDYTYKWEPADVFKQESAKAKSCHCT